MWHGQGSVSCFVPGQLPIICPSVGCVNDLPFPFAGGSWWSLCTALILFFPLIFSAVGAGQSWPHPLHWQWGRGSPGPTHSIGSALGAPSTFPATCIDRLASPAVGWLLPLPRCCSLSPQSPSASCTPLADNSLPLGIPASSAAFTQIPCPVKHQPALCTCLWQCQHLALVCPVISTMLLLLLSNYHTMQLLCMLQPLVIFPWDGPHLTVVYPYRYCIVAASSCCTADTMGGPREGVLLSALRRTLLDLPWVESLAKLFYLAGAFFS